MKSSLINLTVCIAIILGTCTDTLAQNDQMAPIWKSYLDNLTGSWQLTADMDSRKLNQQCEGEWVLQQNFLKFHCKAVAPDTSGYESIYFITYNSDKDHYLFHLFDVYGGSYSETLGFGTLEGNRLTFNFDYPSGLFQNIFIWHEESESWEMILRQKNEKGEWEIFAEKQLQK